MRTTRQLADYIHQTTIADIDRSVIERTKNLAMSSLGSAVRGAPMDVTKLMADYVQSSGGAAKGEATVIGFPFRASAEWAAGLNCIASHCTELEDVAWPDATYTCFLIPTVFSLGDALGASGKQVLEALILGFEVTSRPGVITTDGGGMVRGWLTASAMGTVGVAGAAAKLMGLDSEKTLNAMAIAASFGAGLNRQTGSGAHVIEAGFAGRNGVTAALLAQRGLTGNPTILEGRSGFWDAIAGQPEMEFPLGKGEDFRVMAVGMKKFPCCYLSQRIIDGIQILTRENKLGPDDIEEVDVGVNRIFTQILKYPEPKNAEEARFSLPHIVAAAISGESMFVDTFTEAKVFDPVLMKRRAKVKTTVHDEWGADQLGEKNTVSIRTKDGRSFTRDCFTAHGDPSDPLTRQEILTRYDVCTNGLMSSADQKTSASMLDNLEDVVNVSELMRLYGRAA